MRREPEPGPVLEAVEVRPDRIRWRRLAVTHVAERLPAGRYAAAAFGGLQDSVPRSALLSLHARMEDVGPDAWDHPELVQVWLRAADYVVPRVDAVVFALGARPREPRYAEALDRLADAMDRLLVDGRRNAREVAAGLPELRSPTWIRLAAVTGRFHIRWDTRTTTVIRAPLGGRDTVDPDAARLELARRFLHWHGPAGPSHFARWAGVSRDDAGRTWALLAEADELAPVALAGRGRWLLASDLDAVARAGRPRGVRLLPAGDPCLHVADPDDPAPPPPRQPDAAAGVTQRLLNSLLGRVLVDGAVVGAWGRVGKKVTIDAWPDLPSERVDEVTAAAEDFAGPIGAPIQVRWLDSRPPA